MGCDKDKKSKPFFFNFLFLSFVFMKMAIKIFAVYANGVRPPGRERDIADGEIN